MPDSSKWPPEIHRLEGAIAPLIAKSKFCEREERRAIVSSRGWKSPSQSLRANHPTLKSECAVARVACLRDHCHCQRLRQQIMGSLVKEWRTNSGGIVHGSVFDVGWSWTQFFEFEAIGVWKRWSCKMSAVRGGEKSIEALVVISADRLCVWLNTSENCRMWDEGHT